MRTDRSEDVGDEPENELRQGPSHEAGLSLSFGLGDGPEDAATADMSSESGGAITSASAAARRLGIQHKILSLVVLSAVIPALLAGAVSYFIARRVLTDSIQDQLGAQLTSIEKYFALALDERAQDGEIFASASIVQRALAQSTPEAAETLKHYLDEVRQGYGAYEELVVVGASGETVAASVGPDAPRWQQPPPARLLAASGIALQVTGETPVAVVWRPLGEPSHPRRGALITVSPLQSLWEGLRSELGSDRGRLLIIDSAGMAVFDSQPTPGTERRQVAIPLGDKTRYLNERDELVLGVHRALAPWHLGLLLEVDADRAFADIRRMREVVLVISLLAALFVAALGSLVAVNLSRPITALIRGAESARRGDLSGAIPVTSSDQIGDLTRTFNAMIRALRASRDKLERLSLTDELTGLFNRRYLREVFDKEISRAQRSGAPLSVLMLDFDHFKTYNDLFGHLKGDAFLRDAARVLEDQFRSSDIVARYGGEEFVALLPMTIKGDAAEIAERVRARFDLAEAMSAQMPRVTLSVGVATYPDDGATKEDLISAADVALYAAKERGRNRVEVAGEG
jgi:diguanylate cyclase (GGDEF)-like protein